MSVTQLDTLMADGDGSSTTPGLMPARDFDVMNTAPAEVLDGSGNYIYTASLEECCRMARPYEASRGVIKNDGVYITTVAGVPYLDHSNHNRWWVSTALRKRMVAWAVGDSNGGVRGVDTTGMYDVYSIYRASDGAVDMMFIQRGSSPSANLPSGWDGYSYLTQVYKSGTTSYQQEQLTSLDYELFHSSVFWNSAGHIGDTLWRARTNGWGLVSLHTTVSVAGGSDTFYNVQAPDGEPRSLTHGDFVIPAGDTETKSVSMLPFLSWIDSFPNYFKFRATSGTGITATTEAVQMAADASMESAGTGTQDYYSDIV